MRCQNACTQFVRQAQELTSCDIVRGMYIMCLLCSLPSVSRVFCTILF